MAAVGCDRKTVQRHWNKHLDTLARERIGKTERHRAEAVVRLEKVSAAAWEAVLRARTDADAAAEIRALAMFRQATMDVARLEGVEVQRVEHTGAIAIASVTITETVAEPFIDAEVIESETPELNP